MTKEKLYIDWESFGIWANYLVDKIKNSGRKFDDVYGIPRGGLPLAIVLSHQLNISIILEKNLINDNTLICDEIADSGESLKNYNMNNVIVMFKNKKCKIKPRFWGSVVDKWLIFPWENNHG